MATKEEASKKADLRFEWAMYGTFASWFFSFFAGMLVCAAKPGNPGRPEFIPYFIALGCLLWAGFSSLVIWDRISVGCKKFWSEPWTSYFLLFFPATAAIGVYDLVSVVREKLPKIRAFCRYLLKLTQIKRSDFDRSQYAQMKKMVLREIKNIEKTLAIVEEELHFLLLTKASATNFSQRRSFLERRKAELAEVAQKLRDKINQIESAERRRREALLNSSDGLPLTEELLVKSTDVGARASIEIIDRELQLLDSSLRIITN